MRRDPRRKTVTIAGVEWEYTDDEGPYLAMAAPTEQYVCDQEAAFTMSASTTHYINGVKAHANSGLTLEGFQVSFNGTTTVLPPLVEVLYTTWATNAPGTNSTSTTPRQTNGRVSTAGFTSGRTWTAAPTGGLTPVFPAFYWPVNAGPFAFTFPLGTAPDCALAEGFVIRVVTGSGVTPDARSGLIVSRT